MKSMDDELEAFDKASRETLENRQMELLKQLLKHSVL
jgi:hypothetical protein